MFRRFVLIMLLLGIVGLGLNALPAVGSVSAEQAAIAVDAPDVTSAIRSTQGINQEQPNTPLSVSFYRLRIELSTTARAAKITAQDTEDFLTARLVGVHGNPTRQGLTMCSVWVGQDAGTNSIAITADYAVGPDALDEPIPYLFEQTAEGSSVLRVFNVVDDEETELLAEIHHAGGDPLEFSLGLSVLKGTPPLEGEIQSVQSEKTVWAFYYPWYTDSWNVSILQDQPASGYYNSADRAVIARHVEQAQRAGMDGFISSWWGPGSYTDQNLVTLLDIVQEKDFSVMIDFETLQGSEPRDEATILEWLRYAISTYGDHSAFMKVDGNPVFVLWASLTVPDATWENIFAQLRTEGLEAVFLSMFAPEGPRLDSLEVFDGMHTYNILEIIQSSDQVPTTLAQTYATTGRAVRYYPLLMDSPTSKIWAATVQPGYDDHLIPGRQSPILDREDGALYRSTFDAALNSDPHWIFVTSWNEWWEHTYVEPSELYGEQYLQITRELAGQWKHNHVYLPLIVKEGQS